MPTAIETEPLTCPGCSSTLLSERIGDSAVLCANCGVVFVPAQRQRELRTSRRAVASLMLGGLSVVGLFLTGIPAVWLGVLALRDIQRNSRTLKGKYLAVGGIATGTIFGVMCGACLSMGLAFGWAGRNSMTNTDDPAQVAEIASRVAEFDRPRGTDPVMAIEMGMIGMRTVFFGGEPRADRPLVVVMQYPQGTLRHQVEMQIRDAVQGEDGRRRDSLQTVETATLEFSIAGQSVPVYKTVRFDAERGDRLREYIAEIPMEGTLTFAGLVTPDESDSPGSQVVALSEEEVRAFFESFR